MAIADEHLPGETARARVTSGRSEIEKVLNVDDPPSRISLGTTGYLGIDPARPRPDFLIPLQASVLEAVSAGGPSGSFAPT
jgi:hypothetical protein